MLVTIKIHPFETIQIGKCLLGRQAVTLGKGIDAIDEICHPILGLSVHIL